MTPISTPGLTRTWERSRCIGAAYADYHLRVPGPGCDRRRCRGRERYRISRASSRHQACRYSILVIMEQRGGVVADLAILDGAPTRDDYLDVIAAL